MNKTLLTPQAIAIRVADFRKYVNQAFKVKENDPLHKHWSQTESKLLEILADSNSRPKVTVALVGGTGAGKSTLINALLQWPLLPHSSVKATTAAVCQVDFSENSHYEASVEFITREDWHQEMDALLKDLEEFKESSEADGDGQDARSGITQSARFKLQAIYGELNDSELISLLRSRASEPIEITEAFRLGNERVVSHDLKEFKKKIERFLDSKHRFWPIVKCVRISGPFESLRAGASIVDLPGINDANEAREAVTRQYLKTCRYVWVVFNSKRALTKDATHLLQSDDFLRQIVMDGRAGALTFIGTHSDEIDVDNPDEFNLPEDSPALDIMSARNKAVTSEVVRQIGELSIQLVRAAGEDKDRGDKLQQAFGRCKIFTITAKYFLSLINPHSRREKFEGLTERETQIPALIGHLQSICAGFGMEAKCESLQNQIDLLWREFYREVQNQQAMLQKKSDMTQKQRDEMERQAADAHKVLQTDLKAAQESFVQVLGAKYDFMGERLKRAIERGHNQLDDVCSSFTGIHHFTLGAISRRGGRFQGSSGSHDLPAALSKPILDSIAFAWSEYFGEALVNALDKASNRLLKVAGDHHLGIRKILTMIEEVDPAFHARLSDIVQTTEKILQERLQQAKDQSLQKIEQKQRELYESIPTQVRANMQAGFSVASQERGSGMKKRMVKIIADHASQVSDTMFDDIQTSLLDAVRSLNDWIQRQHAEMAETVRTQSNTATTNLRQEAHSMSLAEMDAQRVLITGLEAALISLGRPFDLVAAQRHSTTSSPLKNA